MARDAIMDPGIRSLDERLEVRRWRRAQFRRLGFGPVEARRLADSGADLALARRLAADGCPVATALAILL